MEAKRVDKFYIGVETYLREDNMLWAVHDLRYTDWWAGLGINTRKGYETTVHTSLPWRAVRWNTSSSVPFWPDHPADATDEDYRKWVIQFKPRSNNLDFLVRKAMDQAVQDGIRDIPFNLSVRKGAVSGPLKPWEDEDVEEYIDERYYKSDGRLVALMYYTGQRIGDCLSLRFRDLRREGIHFRQQKTGQELLIPVHPMLDQQLRKNRDVYEDQAGKYISTMSYNRMPYHTARARIIKQCRLLGIDYRPPHGLRATMAVRLAEAGCTPHQIMAITGHKTLKEVERYTKGVSQQRLAKEAMDKL